MKVKFIKDYINAKKDTIVVLPLNVAKRLIDGGFVEETKETPKAKKKATPKAKKVVAKKVNENKCKGCGDVDEPCDDCNDKK